MSYAPRLISEVDLEDALDVFMSQYQNFKSFPTLSTKHLLFLCGVCYCANDGNASRSKNGDKPILRVLVHVTFLFDDVCFIIYYLLIVLLYLHLLEHDC